MIITDYKSLKFIVLILYTLTHFFVSSSYAQELASDKNHENASKRRSKKKKRKLKTSVKVTDTFTFEARDDNKNLVDDDDQYQIMINRLGVQSKIDKFTFDIKMNTIYFLPPNEILSHSFHGAPNEDYQSDVTNLERITASYKYKKFKLYAGDFYQQLGFGQLLSLRKTDDFNLDIALRGGKIEYKSFQQSMINFAGVSNVINLDPVSQKYIEEKEDVMVGGQYEFRPKAGGEVGVSYLFLKPEDQVREEASPYDATSSAGMFFNFPYLTNWLSLKAEIDVQQRRLAELVEQGHSAYALFDTFYKDTSLQIESLWSENFEQRGSDNSALGRRFDYNLGPTLERIDQEISEFYDVRGTRVRIQQAFLNKKLLLYANGLYRKNKANDPTETDQYHGYAGVEHSYGKRGSKWSASGGHRFDEQAGYINRVWSHAEGYYVQHLKGDYSSHLNTQFQRIRIEQQPFFLRGSTVLSVEKRDTGSIGFEWGIDTQNSSEDARQTFYAFIFNWQFSKHVKLKSLIGSQRGGIKCVGGVCRNFPAFSGVQFNLIIDQFKIL